MEVTFRFWVLFLFSILLLIPWACTQTSYVLSTPSNNFGATPTVTPGTCHPFLSQLGGPGSANGQFNEPLGIALDSSDNVYVVDGFNARVEKFTDSGVYVTQWGGFENPDGIAVDNSGHVYVTDTGWGRVWETSDTGAPVTYWDGSAGIGGNKNQPAGIFLDASKNIYVSESSTNQIVKYSNAGVSLTAWGASAPATGSTAGDFYNPEGLVIDLSGNVEVADWGNGRVERFTSTGTFLQTIGSQGYGTGQFTDTEFVATDMSGNLYVTDANGVVLTFNSSGVYLCTFGAFGSGPGKLSTPQGIALDSSGNIFVVDFGNNRVEKFGP
jgi:tripartite motif-containing protein 71